MAALRNGIKMVILPADNEKDLEEIDQTVRAALHFIPVEQVDTVLAHALGLNPACGTAEHPEAFRESTAPSGSLSIHQ